MEDLVNYKPSEAQLIGIFNKALITFASICLVLLLFLPINDSVLSDEGEIISTSPQQDYLSPYETILDSVYIRDGSSVSIGDTLLTISSTELERTFQSTRTDYENLLHSGKVLQDNVQNIKKRVKYLKNGLAILSEQYKIELLKNNEERKSLDEDVSLLSKKLQVAESRLRVDSSLFLNQVISKLDITNSYDGYLSYVKNYNDARSRLKQNIIYNKTLSVDFNKNLYESKQQLVSLDEELIREEDRLAITLNGILNSEKQLEFYNKEKKKQYILSSIDGTVSHVFNYKRSSSFIQKNEILVSVSPRVNKFFAKLKMPRNEIWQIKQGQIVKLKVDVYYYYEHGILEGVVAHIPERAEKDTDFFIQIELSENTSSFKLRSGYSLKGEVIVEQMKLWKFIFKKIFRKVVNVNV
jgi:hypothetical protein